LPGREQVADWIDRYERAWRAAGTDGLRDLFTDDATYLQGPYEQPRSGLAEIAEMWDEEREGPDEVFTMRSEVIAVDGDTGVARIEVRYGEPVRREYRDLWVMRFAEDGRCSHFEEWPFWPEQRTSAGG
jgi:uncharacterized protein (TIGR02246 family)